MGESANIAAFIAKLDQSIDAVMQNEVAEGAKKALQQAAQSEVYSYTPQFYSRRGTSGGIADTANMTVNYVGNTLTLTDEASWQQLWGGKVPGERLAEAIASGSSRYNFHRAGPRPFHEKAEQDYGGSGQFSRDLMSGLYARGF